MAEESLAEALLNKTTRKVLEVLSASAAGLRFTDIMRETSMQSGELGYHLKKLVHTGLVAKASGCYRLTGLGYLTLKPIGELKDLAELAEKLCRLRALLKELGLV